MADTWETGNALGRAPAPAGGGFFAGLKNRAFEAAEAITGAGQPEPMDRAPGERVRPSFVDRVQQSATDHVLGQYPGYGSLWTYDGGVSVTPMGWAVVAAVVAVVVLA